MNPSKKADKKDKQLILDKITTYMPLYPLLLNIALKFEKNAQAII